MNIASANELSMIAEKLGIDPFELIELANKHPRVNILNPGIGAWGHCLPIEPWFIVEKVPEETKLIKTAREVNEIKTQKVLGQIEVSINYDKSKTIGILGLTCKANTDSIRESPAIKIAKMLVSKGYRVLAHEPYIEKESVSNIKNVDIMELIKESDVIVLAVPHRQFIENLNSILKMTNSKILLDFVGILKKHQR
ncbi:MAG: hypothetical protein Kow0084_20180 [Pseudothermotoga elfii]